MAVIFENPGEIDPRAITTLGVNVKESENPIGFFGTGLKYAIAVLLRLGQGVVIHSGTRTYTFTLRFVSIRGKEFQLICMNGQELGFTTEFGKKWELWMAYRELWCNAQDENGRAFLGEEFQPREGFTYIVVDGLEFEEVHHTRDQFLLVERTPRFKTPEIEIYSGSSRYFFYRGIRVGEVPVGRSGSYTYNILESLDLTEDRTVKYSWVVENCIAAAVLQSTDRGFIYNAVGSKKSNSWESQLDYDMGGVTASEEFLKTVEHVLNTKAGELSDSAHTKYVKQTKKKASPEGRPMQGEEIEVVQKAVEFADRLGFPTSAYKVLMCDGLGEGTLAIAVMNEATMLLSPKLVAKGWAETAAGVIEETVHLRYRHQDCTRSMQDFLFETIVRLGKQITGEGGGGREG